MGLGLKLSVAVQLHPGRSSMRNSLVSRAAAFVLFSRLSLQAYSRESTGKCISVSDDEKLLVAPLDVATGFEAGGCASSEIRPGMAQVFGKTPALRAG